MIENEEENTDDEMSSYFQPVDGNSEVQGTPNKKLRLSSIIVTIIAILSMVMLIIWLYKGQNSSQDISLIESDLLGEQIPNNKENLIDKKQELDVNSFQAKKNFQQSTFLDSLKEKIQQRNNTSEITNTIIEEDTINKDVIVGKNRNNNNNNNKILTDESLEANNLDNKEQASFFNFNNSVKPINQKDDIEQLQNSVNELSKITTYYYKIQLAAYGNKVQAESLWVYLLNMFPQWLDGLEPQYSLSNKGLYRLRAGHYSNKTSAESLCAQLKNENQSCFVVSIALN